MKTLAFLFCVAFGVGSAPAVVALSPGAGTNDLAAIYMANNANRAWQSCYYVIGKVDRLEREVDILETGFVVLSGLLMSTVAAVCILTTRDRIRERRV